jgi:hypothetical protein
MVRSNRYNKTAGTLTALVRFTSQMRRIIKSVLLFVAVAACVLGTLFSPKEPPRERSPKTDVVPVKNAQPKSGVWLRV